MTNLLFQLLLFFLPLLIWSFGNSAYEIPKVIVGMLTIDVLGIYVVLKRKTTLFSFDRRLLVLICTLVLLTVYDLIFRFTGLSLWGNQFRMQGIVLLWHLLVLALISSQFPYKRMSYFWYGCVTLAVTASSFVLGNSVSRSVGTLGEPNALAAFIVFLWPFLFFAPDLPSKYRRPIQIGLLLLALLVIGFSGSRSGLLAFILQIFIYGVFKTSKRLKYAVFVGLVFTIIVQCIPFIAHVMYEDRAVIWQTAFAAGWLHSFLGGGFGNIELLLRRIIIAQHNTLIGYYIDSSHNFLLDMWVQGGVLGLGVFVSLLIFTVKRFYERRQIVYITLLFGLLITLLFNPASVVGLIGLWWLIGQGFVVESGVVS